MRPPKLVHGTGVTSIRLIDERLTHARRYRTILQLSHRSTPFLGLYPLPILEERWLTSLTTILQSHPIYTGSGAPSGCGQGPRSPRTPLSPKRKASSATRSQIILLGFSRAPTKEDRGDYRVHHSAHLPLHMT